MNKNFIKAIGCIALLSSSALISYASPSQANSTIAVDANVVNVCSVSSGNMDIGNYDQQVNNFDTTIDVTCTAGAIYDIDLNLGANPDGTTRRMNGPAPTDFLTYEIYKDAGRTQVWRDASDGLTNNTADGSAQQYTAYGQVPAGQTNAPAGRYIDNITVAVTF